MMCMESINALYLVILCLQCFWFLTYSDLTWHANATQNNRLPHFNRMYPHTKYEKHPSFIFWDILISLPLFRKFYLRWAQMTFDLYWLPPKNKVYFLTIMPQHTKLEKHPCFLQWSNMVVNFLILDLTWDLTASKNNELLPLNTIHLNTDMKSIRHFYVEIACW